MADVLTQLSYGQAMPQVNFPKLGTLAELTGIARQHVHNALKSLHQVRMPGA